MRSALTSIKLQNDSRMFRRIAVGHYRVSKAICLLEFIRDLPRTEANLAAVLVDEVGQATPLRDVQSAVQRLNTAQFIRNTEGGWKLQTAQEKNWETERRGYLEPKPRDRNEIARNALHQIFDRSEEHTS